MTKDFNPDLELACSAMTEPESPAPIIMRSYSSLRPYKPRKYSVDVKVE